MFFKKLKIGDYVVVILITILILFLFNNYIFSGSKGEYVEISGEDFKKSFSLFENRVVNVNGQLGVTKVVIKNRKVWIEESPCREKICIKMGKISKTGEQVICVPNRILVEVKGKDKSVDAVSR